MPASPRVAARRRMPEPETSAGEFEAPVASRRAGRRPAELEPALARLLRDVDGAGHDAEARSRAAAALAMIAARLAPGDAELGAARPDDLLGAVRDLVSRPREARGALQLAEQIDEFGRDLGYEARVQPLIDAFIDRYFHVELEGIEHVPAEGAALFVCNRGGILPWDGLVLKSAIRSRHPDQRVVRWLTEDFVYHAPFLGAALNRLGAARACQENAERLLRDGQLLAVFPEGEKGVGKTFKQRYRLQRFGRGGYVKLALRTRAPLIPVAIVGAEECYPLIHRVTAFSRAVGLPFIPVTPLFPWFGPFGLVPLPSRWRITIGTPIDEITRHPASVANDASVVNRVSEQVRATLQRMLDASVAERGSRVFAWPTFRG